MKSCIQVFLCVAMFLSPIHSKGAPAPLRIASFNMKWLAATASESHMDPWHSEASLEAHRHALARILAERVRADVVCVLEVLSRQALEKLAAEPVLRFMGYSAYHLESEDTGTGQDVAFLVRVPLDKVDGKEIRRFSLRGEAPASVRSRKNRGPVHSGLTKNAVIYLTVGKLKLGILGIHLLAHPDDHGRTRKREIQAALTAQIVRDEIVKRGYTPIVMGDFNDFDPDVEVSAGVPDSRRTVLRRIKDFDSKTPGYEMFNAAERIKPITERYSAYWDKNDDEKLDAGDVLSLLDHILLAQALAPRLKNVVIQHEAHDGTVSDHWPVVVDLER